MISANASALGLRPRGEKFTRDATLCQKRKPIGIPVIEHAINVKPRAGTVCSVAAVDVSPLPVPASPALAPIGRGTDTHI